ncbi:trypsin Inhibitor like cysteine rich domain protein [Ancylostoma duodenale]|uniref:Trypsin Inhibitor like cysteine rich domain protein n=1 Tax=Ancylostoma duodenale TaxID=51022 RepID=A0A0C2D8P6_9BILA|nr:trypsin Inhibitor like cysteine rich domain protein [Ancylostoma duodenale]
MWLTYKLIGGRKMKMLNLIAIWLFFIWQCSGKSTETTKKCGPNEFYDVCAGNDCEPTCEDQDKEGLSRACFDPAACFCDRGFYRNKEGKCVTDEECEDDNMEIITLPPEEVTTPAVNSTSLRCSNNEVFDECGNDCESKCNEKEKRCKKGRLCFVGAGACACGDGFYRNKAGKCVTEDECEDDNMEIATLPPEAVTTPAVNSTSTVCSRNEVFDECGNDCENKCNEKKKVCNVRVCFVGGSACACGDGFYRNKAGKCVTEDER